MSDLLPEQQPPEQTTTAVSGDMDVHVTCTPPLGQPTIIPKDKPEVKFTVLLETTSPSSTPEVVLWHNHNGEHEWCELPLKPSSKAQVEVVLLSHTPDQQTHYWFSASLSGLPKHGHKVSFTLKYRNSPKEDWTWVKDTTGFDDGELYYQAPVAFMQHSNSYELDRFISGTCSDIKVEKAEPETSHTQLWSLTCPVHAAKGKDSGYEHHCLGKVIKGERWFALVRLWSPWLAPRHGHASRFELDKEAILLSFLRSDGLHVVCLAISGVDDVMTTFVYSRNGGVEIKGRNDRESEGKVRVLVAVAESFEVANCAVMYHARKVIAEYSSSSDLKQDTQEIKTLMNENVKPEWLETWYDYLTYCTWNGLGQALTAKKIYDALDELAKHEINIANLIIDDNWQSLSTGASQFQKGWSEFEANPSGFPDGLKGTTAEIRKRHKNVGNIAVWHAILGYWGGIDPNGKIAEQYKTIEVEKEPGVAGGKFTVVAAEDAKRMYNDFYSFLAESGISAVKTDAQFFLEMLLHAPDRRAMITEYQDAWTLAHLRHFMSRAISCMSQFPQALFHSQLPRNKPRLLVRNSDDFFPKVEASHPWHIFCNAHNSLFTQHLNALPDWDMFQTSHDWAAFHAAARCVSGGPIYITDKPGEHDINLIRQMTAQTTQGRTIILRPSIVGKTVGSVYNPYSSKTILKIGTFVGRKGSGTGILGLFNMAQQELREFIPMEVFPGVEEGTEYVVSSFTSTSLKTCVSRNAAVHVGLKTKAWDVLAAYPLQKFTVSGKEVKVACMGLLGKMTGAAGVLNTDMYVESNGRLRIWVGLKALGTLGLWISDLEESSVGARIMVMIYKQPVPEHCVSTKEDKGGEKTDGGGVLEIDVARAWNEMGFSAGWSNEVEVEVFVS